MSDAYLLDRRRDDALESAQRALHLARAHRNDGRANALSRTSLAPYELRELGLLRPDVAQKFQDEFDAPPADVGIAIAFFTNRSSPSCCTCEQLAMMPGELAVEINKGEHSDTTGISVTSAGIKAVKEPHRPRWRTR